MGPEGERAAEAPAGRLECLSCGHPLEGRYCSNCGEKRLDPRELTVRHFLVHTLAPEILDLDGRIWRTLGALLFRPARLTLAYTAGRRRRYVQPLRILITAIIVYALIASQSGTGITLGIGQLKLSVTPVTIPSARSIPGTLDQIDRNEILEQMFEDKIGPAEAADDDVREAFNQSLSAFVTPVSFLSVVLLALVLYACFHRRRPLLLEHAVFSMHYFSFVLLWTLLLIAAIGLGLTGSFATTITLVFGLMFWQFVYLTIALRRFYWPASQSRLVPWLLAGTVGLLIHLANSTFITLVQLAGGAIAIWRL